LIYEKYLGTLKNIPRVGWLQREIPKDIAETVAEHTFEVTFWSLWLTSECTSIDRYEILAMAILHDFAESIIGDIPRSALHNNYLKDIKKNYEMNAGNIIFREDPSLGNIYKKYMDGENIEALIIELADELSTAIQSYRYKKLGYPTDDILEKTIKNVILLTKKVKLQCIQGKISKILKEIFNKKI